jgi:hypothetical protein
MGTMGGWIFKLKNKIKKGPAQAREAIQNNAL